MVCHMLQNWAGRCDTRKQNCDTLHFLRCCKLRVSRKSFLELKLLKKGKPGVKIYRKLYAEEKEVSNGVLAICVSKLAAQPYLSLASILFGLSYGGVQSQLGTAGSALAKHAERSSDRFQSINRLGRSWWKWGNNRYGTSIGLVVSMHILMYLMGKIS
ncbi:uncharacterized protein LOC18106874 isoform X5 [Populus trichocarpa]|uniref:uncharacterized protein LOC18106874 isoform X5 n=1 Tax=Populus trichocarpa TaxID=3694 RepID=UPI00227822A0|nr:uncharacterized protein LOC18106874 isoform X5 [Populus trichocarpa]